MSKLEDIYEEIDNYFHKKAAHVQMLFVAKKLAMERRVSEIRAETFGYGINETQPEKDFRLEIFKRDTNLAMINQMRELWKKRAREQFDPE